MDNKQLSIVKTLLKKTAEYSLAGCDDLANKFYNAALRVTAGEKLSTAITKSFDKSEVKQAASIFTKKVARERYLTEQPSPNRSYAGFFSDLGKDIGTAWNSYDGGVGGLHAMVSAPWTMLNKDGVKELKSTYTPWAKGWKDPRGSGLEMADQILLGMVPNSMLSNEHLRARFPNASSREEALQQYEDDALAGNLAAIGLSAGRVGTRMAANGATKGLPAAARYLTPTASRPLSAIAKETGQGIVNAAGKGVSALKNDPYGTIKSLPSRVASIPSRAFRGALGTPTAPTSTVAKGINRALNANDTYQLTYDAASLLPLSGELGGRHLTPLVTDMKYEDTFNPVAVTSNAINSGLDHVTGQGRPSAYAPPSPPKTTNLPAPKPEVASAKPSQPESESEEMPDFTGW
jgi:hypothetical protein